MIDSSEQDFDKGGKMRGGPTVEARPISRFVRERALNQNELARKLAARTGRNVSACSRWLARLHNVSRVRVKEVDELCLVLGRHLSDFDPEYQKQEEEQ